MLTLKRVQGDVVQHDMPMLKQVQHDFRVTLFRVTAEHKNPG
jgi:hypothetical protein